VITPAECKAARKLLGWAQSKLAEMLFVGEGTIGQFERRQRHWRSLNLHKLRSIFESAGVEFTNGEKSGVRLKKDRA
jgi:transcriptional regulator with XRE-family HTH domain